MAFVHGKSAAALLDGFDISAYVRSGDFSAEIDTAETSTWSSSWKSYIAGNMKATVSLDGLFDTAMVPNFTGQIGDTPGGLLTFGPGGLALGAPCRLLQVIESSYGETASIGDVVGFTYEATTNTVLGIGHVIAASAAVSADQNGTSVDLTAASTTGAIAFLHVTSVSASDSIVVTIEDSSTGSSGWATIGTFASKAAAGAERIVIAGTVKRYVRVVDDVTGTGVSIVRAVALART
jgi:hypothetical protein